MTNLHKNIGLRQFQSKDSTVNMFFFNHISTFEGLEGFLSGCPIYTWTNVLGQDIDAEMNNNRAESRNRPHI